MTDWLIDCEPREVQLEALSRSYEGFARYDRLGEARSLPLALPHAGNGPARGWGHFLEMRLGKTPLTLNEYLLLRRDHGIRYLLVIAPNKFKRTWELEARKFGVDVPAFVYEANRGKRDYDKFLTSAGRKGEGMLVVNYESLRSQKHFDRVVRFVADREFMLVLDESAMVKTPRAKTTKKVQELADRATFRRALSGMPAPYAPYDLWSQLRCLKVLERFNNFYAFKHTFTRMGGFQGKQALGIKNEEALDKYLFTRSFRAKKVDWGLNIGVDYEMVELEMTDAQRSSYKQMEDDFVLWLSSESYVSAANVIVKHMKLQQIASGFVYNGDGDAMQVMNFEKTPKFIDLKDRLDNYIQGKVIVIAHYRNTLRSLYKHLRDYNPSYIVGGMKSEEVERQKEKFNNDPRCKVILGQGQAIKYGHTLIGTKEAPCHSMCFFENDYNLDTRAQCEARPQGAHQTAQVHIWDYHSCPVEKRVTKALQKRQKISDVIMGAYR